MWEDINDSRLAELLGTTTATVSRWMGGQMPSRAWLAKLEASLPVTAQYLEYGGDDLGFPPERPVLEPPATRQLRSHSPQKTASEVFGSQPKRKKGGAG